jgi:tripartite-type tricarboxylate transporter receptor subunit TctC
MPLSSDARRRALQALGLAAAGAALPLGLARAQAFPSKPVRVLVGASAGGPSDFLGRLFGEAAAARFGQPFVVDNKAGASGTIAGGIAAKAPADGHTLYASGPASTVIAPHVFAKLDYDPERELTPITLLGAGAFVLVVHPSVPANTVAEFTALAKGKPDSLNYGSGGIGSSGHLCTESYAERAGVKLRHVPYKGDGQAINDLLANQIQVMFTAPNVAMAHAKSGKLKLLAVTTQERVPSMPEVPAVHETLPGFEYLGWIILFAPAGTPAAALTALADVWMQARVTPAVKERLETLGMYPPARYGTRESLLAFLQAEKQRTGQLVKKLEITPN